MDFATLIVAALVAGLSAGTASVAEQAIKDAYNGLKTVIEKRYTKLRSSIDYLEADPEGHRAVVEEDFRTTDAVNDLEISKKAEILTEAIQVYSPNPELRNRAAVILENIRAGGNVKIGGIAALGQEAVVSVKGIEASGDFEASNLIASNQRDPKV